MDEDWQNTRAKFRRIAAQVGVRRIAKHVPASHTHDYRQELAAISADTAKAPNSDLFSSDFSINRAGNLVCISVQLGAAAALNVVPNSGSALHLGTVSANTLTTFTLALDHGRTWNLQHGAGSDTTFEHCVVQELQG